MLINRYREGRSHHAKEDQCAIIGTAGSNPACWPNRVFSAEPAQQVVLALAEAPQSEGELAEILPGGRQSLDEVVQRLLDLQAIG